MISINEFYHLTEELRARARETAFASADPLRKNEVPERQSVEVEAQNKVNEAFREVHELAWRYETGLARWMLKK